MFRRKEDSLFDTTADQAQSEVSTESATVVAPAAAATSTSSTSSIANTFGIPPVPPAQTTRPAQSAFRPAQNTTNVTSELTRNRMPEARSNNINTAAAAAAPVAQAVPAASIPAPSDKANKSGRRVLTVGNDILLKGEIATCDRLVIEGKVDATLNDVHTVEIAETGSFKGSAHIEDAEISGLFEGDLIVRNRLVIYATGKVRGKITYGEIEVERGGELSGEIKTISSTAQTTTSSSRSSRSSSSSSSSVPKDDKVAA